MSPHGHKEDRPWTRGATPGGTGLDALSMPHRGTGGNLCAPTHIARAHAGGGASQHFVLSPLHRQVLAREAIHIIMGEKLVALRSHSVPSFLYGGESP